MDPGERKPRVSSHAGSLTFGAQIDNSLVSRFLSRLSAIGLLSFFCSPDFSGPIALVSIVNFLTFFFLILALVSQNQGSISAFHHYVFEVVRGRGGAALRILVLAYISLSVEAFLSYLTDKISDDFLQLLYFSYRLFNRHICYTIKKQ